MDETFKMTAEQLPTLRRRLDYTQGAKARAMGLSLRAYQELEGQDRDIHARHEILACFVALERAVEVGDISLPPPRARRAALRYGNLVTMDDMDNDRVG